MTKRLKDKCLSITTAQLMGVIVMLSIASCQKNCKPSKEASLTLKIDKNTLTDKDKVHVSIKSNSKGKAASLAKFSLKASIITEAEGTGSMLQYTNAANDTESRAKIDQSLTHFTKDESLNPNNSINIAFAVKPGPGVSKATVTLELYDTKKGVIVAKETVEWVAASIQLAFKDLTKKVENGDTKIKFKVENTGVVNSDKDKLWLKVTNTTTGSQAKLKELGDKDKMKLGKLKNISSRKTSTETTLTIEPQGAQAATFELELIYDGQSVAKETVEWIAASIQLAFKDLTKKVENGDTKIKFKVENTGVVNSDKDKLWLKVTNTTAGSQAKLKELGDKDKMKLGKLKNISSRKTSTETILTIEPQGAQAATFELELIYDGQSVAKETVEWIAASIQLAFKDLTKKVENGDTKIKFKVENTGVVNSDKDKLWLKVTNTTAGSQAKLKELGDKDKMKLGKLKNISSRKTSTETILTIEPQGAQAATFELELIYDGQSVAKETVEWIAASIQLAFKDLTKKVENGDTKIKFKVENTGVVNSDKDKLWLKVTNTTAGSQAKLKELGDKDKMKLGKLKNISSRKTSTETILTIEPQGAQAATFELELIYDGQSVAKETVEWVAASIQLAFKDLTKKVENGDTKIKFKVENTGVVNSDKDKLWLKVTNTTAGSQAKLKELGDKDKMKLGKLKNISSRKTSTETILTIEPQGAQAATFELELIYDGQSVAKETVEWIEPVVQLVFKDSVDQTKLELGGYSPIKINFKVKNDMKDPLEKSKLRLKARKLNNRKSSSIKGFTSTANLQDYYSDMSALWVGDIEKNSTSNDFEVEIDPGGCSKVSFSFQLMYDDKPVGKPRVVSWSKG